MHNTNNDDDDDDDDDVIPTMWLYTIIATWLYIMVPRNCVNKTYNADDVEDIPGTLRLYKL